ncbi:MAG: DNA recombination protein RmuC [Bacteroidales bacterium]|jgi:DNA recombination protein RmuC
MDAALIIAGVAAGILLGGVFVWYFMNKRLVSEKAEVKSKESELRMLEVELASSKTSLEHKNEELKEMQEKLTVSFENLAHKILETTTQKLEEKSSRSLQQLLDPLKVQMQDFKDKMEATHLEDTKQRSTLDERIRNLVEKTLLVSTQAENLTQALKGQSKTRGDWGEMILERILEHSGLEQDTHYTVQKRYTNEDGKVIAPDVLVRLPGDRVVVIDSKVSLVDYDRYVAAENQEEQAAALAGHIDSVKRHVQELAAKKYHSIENTLDFTIMFVPVEPAYILAVQSDPNLWNEAYARKIVLVSPTNLIASLRLISDLWSREKQSQNAIAIAARGEKLLSKFEGFVKTLEQVGESIDKSQQAYDTAIKQLSTGKGNLIRQAEILRQLGVKATGKIVKYIAEGDGEEEETNEAD